jgi:tripartite-type tricarboxylate transporter receptor subunit TctC
MACARAEGCRDGVSFEESLMAMAMCSFGRSSVMALCAAVLGLVVQAAAQDYPQRPITFVVGLGAGGGQDINSRIYADVLSRNLGQRVVVDNRTGAGGGVAASYVQNAAPDGYTLLVVSGLQHTYVPATQPGLYEPVNGFAPVSLMFEIVSTLAVPAENPAQNVAEFLEYGRQNPGGITVGAPGPGSPPHMFAALIGEATRIPVRTIQYRGSSQAMTDLAAGRIDVAFPTYGLGKPFIDQKTVKPIAVAADKRWSEFPELPTLVEAGLVKHMVAMWFGLLAPAGTPSPIIQRLNDEIVKASRDPELVRRMTATGTSIRVSAPDEMRSLLAAEATNVNAMVQRLGLRDKP